MEVGMGFFFYNVYKVKWHKCHINSPLQTKVHVTALLKRGISGPTVIWGKST